MHIYSRAISTKMFSPQKTVIVCYIFNGDYGERQSKDYGKTVYTS